MARAIIKKTGYDAYVDNLDSTDDIKTLYLGPKYEAIHINNNFDEHNILVISNPLGFESGLEPNIFVYDNKKDIPVTRCLFGNVIFYKYENNSYSDLTDEDIEFIFNYINTYNMTEKDKAMAGLFQYNPKDIALRFNKK